MEGFVNIWHYEWLEWKCKIVDSDQSHQSYNEYKIENSSNTSFCKYRRLNQMSRTSKHWQQRETYSFRHLIPHWYVQRSCLSPFSLWILYSMCEIDRFLLSILVHCWKNYIDTINEEFPHLFFISIVKEELRMYSTTYAGSVENQMWILQHSKGRLVNEIIIIWRRKFIRNMPQLVEEVV